MRALRVDKWLIPPTQSGFVGEGCQDCRGSELDLGISPQIWRFDSISSLAHFHWIGKGYVYDEMENWFFYLLWACPVFILPFAQRNSGCGIFYTRPSPTLYRVRADGGSGMGSLRSGQFRFSLGNFRILLLFRDRGWMLSGLAESFPYCRCLGCRCRCCRGVCWPFAIDGFLEAIGYFTHKKWKLRKIHERRAFTR